MYELSGQDQLDITSIESAIKQFDFSWQGRPGYGDSNKSF